MVVFLLQLRVDPADATVRLFDTVPGFRVITHDLASSYPSLDIHLPENRWPTPFLGGSNVVFLHQTHPGLFIHDSLKIVKQGIKRIVAKCLLHNVIRDKGRCRFLLLLDSRMNWYRIPPVWFLRKCFRIVLEELFGRVVIAAAVDVVTDSNIGRKGDKTLLINIASEAAFFPTRRATCFATRPVFLQMKTIVSHTHHETLITSCTCAVCTSPCSLPSSCALLHGAHSLVKVFV